LRDRRLNWDGCVNVRDLGGHATEDGGMTGFGRIVRADCVRKLSEEGWESAVAFGIRTVVDLRFHEELDADPPRELPMDVVHISLFGVPDQERWRALDARAAAAGDEVAWTRLVYVTELEEHRANFAEVLRSIAGAREGGVLVHCAAGKDRTGLVTALLLRLVGVSIADVAADYALSERNLAGLSGSWIAEAPDDHERARRRRIARSPARAMSGVLEELERRHGGAAAYLRASGASDDDLERARARLLA
jgi:protein-tyrosine phosphatase